MSLSAHTIKSAPGSRKTSKRVGRGNSSQKGTYSSRGMKGQKSRSGGKSGNKLRGFKASLQKIPKNRGFKSLIKPKETVTLSTLERITKVNDVVTPYSLEKIGVISSAKLGVKIVAKGELTHAINVNGCIASKNAAIIIEKAGGKLIF